MQKLLIITAALIAAASPAYADPVTAVAAWVGTTFAVGAATAMAITQLAFSFATSMISRALFKPDRPPVSVTFEVDMGDNLPLSFIAGDYVTAGKRKYIGSWGKNTRYITEVIEISSLPQPSLVGMWVNDEVGEIRFDLTDSLGRGHPVTNYRDDGEWRIWVKWVDGTQAAADPFLVSTFGSDPDYPWTAAMVGKGKSYAIVTTRYDAETLTTYPAYLFQPAPLPCYDLRFDSTNGGSGPQRWNNPATWTATNNPAVIAYNIIRGVYFGTEWVYGGKNLPAWRLPQAEWIAAANACDASVPKAGGGTEPRYRCGMEIFADTEPAAILEEIGKSANMRFAEVGGRIKPIVDLPGAAVFSITDDDILITEGQSFRPFLPVSQTYNTISATYPEPGEKWATKDAPVFVDEAAKAKHGGRHLPVSMSYPAVPFGAQVQRLERSQMQDYQRQRQHEFYLPPDAYGLEPGIDVLSYGSNRNGYVNKLFVIERVSRVPGMNVLVTLREVDPGDYDWSSDFEQPTTITPPVNPVPFVQTADGFNVAPAVVEDATGARRADVLASYAGDEIGITNIQIRGRVQGQTAITVDTLRRWNSAQEWRSFDVLPATAYEFQALLLSELTPRGAWSEWKTVTTPDVKFDWIDFEQSIKDELDAAEAEAQQAAQDARDALAAARAAGAYTDAQVQGVRDEVDADLLLLAADVSDAQQLAIDNLLIAQTYTDTSVQSETVARTTETGQLAARIDQITAAATSNNLLVNGDFADGATGWTGVTVSGGKGTVQAAGAQQTFATTFSAAELLQWRMDYSGPAGQVRVGFLDGSGALIGSEFVTNLAATATTKVGSGQHAPPESAAQVRLRVTGTGLVIDNAAATRIDQQTIARIQTLETAVASDVQALATYKSETNARFGNNETAITNEASARADADSSLSISITGLQSYFSGGQVKATALTNYYTKAAADTAMSVATTSLKASMEGPGGSVKAAQDAAQDASNLAGSKGKVIVQNSAPATSDRQAQNLWIDTTGGANTPKRWSGSAWVAVTDKAATDAAAAAAAAQGKANAVEANLTNNYYTKAAANSAISANIATYDASIPGGVKSKVTQTSTALADLKGNIASFKWIAQTGGAGAAGIEAVSVNSNGQQSKSAVILHGDEVIAPGTLSTNKLVVGMGKNLLVDPEFQNDMRHWGAGGGGGIWAQSMVYINAAGNAWAGLTSPVVALRQDGTAQDGYTQLAPRPQINTEGIGETGVPVEPGQWYCASAYWSMHRCDGGLYIGWRRADGSIISYSYKEIPLQGSGSVDNPELWPRVFVIGQAPPDAVMADVLQRKGGTKSGTNSYIFIYHPQLEKTHANATEPAPWDSGSVGMWDGKRLFSNTVVARHVSSETTKALNGRFVNLAAANITVGNGEIDNAKIGNVIQSNNFVSGEGGVGWRILKSGAAEFNTVTIRRQIEVASGSVYVGDFVYNNGATPQSVSVLSTPIPLTAWQASDKTYIVNAGMRGTVSSSNTSQCYWGWDGTVLPLTKWSGNQSLRLRFEFVGLFVTQVQNCYIDWKIYQVS